MQKKQILYISGNGHSGSTLLDIILGSQENAFSAGELLFLPEKGIKNREYCSCGNPVPDCTIWKKVIEEWNSNRILDLEEYIQLQYQLVSNKNIFSTYRKLANPSGSLLDFLKDTQLLYKIIFNITESNIIIDSSKAPSRILILKNLDFDIKILHLTRRFGDVLNSNKKRAKKNLEVGIEHDITPKKTSYVAVKWFLNNFLSLFFSKDLSCFKIKYEEIVRNPFAQFSYLNIDDSEFFKKLTARGPFYPEHLVAGNKIRMKEKLFIAEKPMNTSYSRLNFRDKLLARVVDFFYQ